MNWAQLHEAVLNFGGWLTQPGQTIPPVPHHAEWGEPTYAEEKWADEWVREFFVRPALDRPPTPRQRYVLLPRFRYAATEVSIWARCTPTELVPDPKLKWEELLVAKWHAKGRDLWLKEPHLPGDDEASLSS